MHPTSRTINEVVAGPPRTEGRCGILVLHALWVGRAGYGILRKGLGVIVDLYPLGPELCNFLPKSSTAKNIWHNIGKG